MDLSEQIRQQARELLKQGRVGCVIGYERGSDGVCARPAFVYSPPEAHRLIFDNTCTHNLVNYLLGKKGEPVAVVAKPCDARAVNVLLLEKQLQRESVVIIGVVCPGVVQTRWNQVSDKLQPRCELCLEHTPVVYDFLVGEPLAERPAAPSFADVEQLERRSVTERAALWRQYAERCIRCYACRNVCMGCYCPECFVEQLDPEWVGIRIAPEQNETWHIVRAFHLAGRCIRCNECERVCPLHIPLSLLNRKLIKEVVRLFGFEAGKDAEQPAPLTTFSKEEKLESQQ